ncbi:hypothetical protein [Nonomuraea sp. GTA35]|uniref:hypothetical protein n=1 Tax=Nonomuraea sp. GTA35 TaxID=1676746 RepID=UPI0035C1D578
MTKVLETLAAYTQEYLCDSGGGHLKTALLAAVLTEQQQIPAAEAIDLAAHEPWDPRVREASQEKDRLLHQAWLAAMAAEQDGQVPA